MRANLLLFSDAFQLNDTTKLSILLDNINDTVILASDNGDRICGNKAISEMTVLEGIYYYDFTMLENLATLKTFIPNITRDHQMIIVKLLRYANTPAGATTLATLEEEFDHQNNGLLGLDFSNSNIQHENIVHDTVSWYYFHRQYYVDNPPTRQKFCEELEPYFNKMHFNAATVTTSLNTLHKSHEEIMKTIIYHLSALNDVYYNYFIENQRIGLDAGIACRKLEEYYLGQEIKIGASRDVNGIKELEIKFIYIDIKKGINEERVIYCDLHTKFYSYYEDPNPNADAQANRIYFQYPQHDFIPGKILIGKIGRHRN